MSEGEESVKRRLKKNTPNVKAVAFQTRKETIENGFSESVFSLSSHATFILLFLLCFFTFVFFLSFF